MKEKIVLRSVCQFDSAKKNNTQYNEKIPQQHHRRFQPLNTN